jgi:hypothetical protein
LLDGAWWPRYRDLKAELPSLTAVFDPLWGRPTRVTVNPVRWPFIPRNVPVAGHAVNVGWFLAEQDEHELLLSRGPLEPAGGPAADDARLGRMADVRRQRPAGHVDRDPVDDGSGASADGGRERPGRGSRLGLRRRA